MSSTEQRPGGTFRQRFVSELWGNSAHFPLALIVLESLSAHGGTYWFDAGPYLLMFSGALQAAILCRLTSPLGLLFGQLIGPASYALVEVLAEGIVFFSQPHHLAYFAYGLVIGLLRSLHGRLGSTLGLFLTLIESVVRASILFTLYTLFELSRETDTTFASFWNDLTHQYIAAAVVLLGVSVGLAARAAERYQSLLLETSQRLRTYSEWLLGRELLNRLVADPQALALQRRERTILFMDIRNFTRWSDTRPPERVAAMLDDYYQCAEALLGPCTVKFKFTADEVMAVFADPATALRAAQQLRAAMRERLAHEDLGAGIGIHCGEVVEGLLGSAGVKFYDVLGDTVNIAKRIEGAAHAGEILASARTVEVIARPEIFAPPRTIWVKGKEAPLTVYPLHDLETPT